MRTSTIVALAATYTIAVSAMVSLTEVSGGVVIAVAWAWFCIGRMVGRKGASIKWGRQ